MSTPLIIFFIIPLTSFLFFFFFNDTATTEIYTLSLHDALPISNSLIHIRVCLLARFTLALITMLKVLKIGLKNSRTRSEEHTSELQSLRHLVCRLLLEKKKIKIK